MTMKLTTVTGLSIFALALTGGLAFAAGQYGPGASDSEIKIGNTMPYSAAQLRPTPLSARPRPPISP